MRQQIATCVDHKFRESIEQATQQVDQMIADTQARFGVTSIVISHDMASTFRIAHQISMLARGQVIISGTPEQLAASSTPEVLEFIEASGVKLASVRRAGGAHA